MINDSLNDPKLPFKRIKGSELKLTNKANEKPQLKLNLFESDTNFGQDLFKYLDVEVQEVKVKYI